MTTDELTLWRFAYEKRYLTPGENRDFIETWEDDLLRHDLRDALAALADLGRDTSYNASHPRLHLGLILKYAAEHRERRMRRENPPMNTGNPFASEYDARDFRNGTIDKAEFDRRKRERKAVAK